MVGNDIVDLRDPESDPRTLSPRFDERVLTRAEHERLAALPAGDGSARSPRGRERWSLWAAKEAAYKLARKQDERVIFSPVRFEVMLAPRTEVAISARHACAAHWRRSGRVRHGGSEFEVRLVEGDHFVHAVATMPGDRDGVTSGLAELEEAEAIARGSQADRVDHHVLQGEAVRRLACRALAERLDVSEESLELRKHGRVPILFARGHRVDGVDVSLSHHGELVAFASQLNRVRARWAVDRLGRIAS
jgi:phosphopantetheinyl transferase (holo-ACP synthase)